MVMGLGSSKVRGPTPTLKPAPTIRTYSRGATFMDPVEIGALPKATAPRAPAVRTVDGDDAVVGDEDRGAAQPLEAGDAPPAGLVQDAGGGEQKRVPSIRTRALDQFLTLERIKQKEI